jgi:hypothetical protein
VNLSSRKEDVAKFIENLMVATPFPRPFKEADLKPLGGEAGLKLAPDSDISQQELAQIWLQIIAPGKVKPDVGSTLKDRVQEQIARVSLYDYVAYVTLMIRLTRSYLAGQVSGAIFTTLVFDWNTYLGRLAAKAGFHVDMQLQNLVELADKYPEIEQEKGSQGMLDDTRLHQVARQILGSLEGMWNRTKSDLAKESFGKSPS